MSDEARKPVRPRAAASVVLVRGEGAKAEVLMGRRRRRASFLPNVYVFPGGRVDAADRLAPGGVGPSRETDRLLRRRAAGASPLALTLAGLRETHEETGYLIARKAGKRELAEAPDAPFWNAMKAAGLMPDLARMDYIARALTPAASRRRFDTRFFLVAADDAAGEPIADGELEDLHWLPLAEAHRLPIVDATEFVLNLARRRRAERRRSRSRNSVPFLRYVRDRPRIDRS